MNKIYNYNTKEYTKNNEKSYYLLGLIASDGCLDGYHIQIHSKDKYFLEKIRDDLVPDKPLYKDKRNDVFRLKISSKKIMTFVKESGLTENKSLDLKVNPNLIKSKNFRHFIRGYFDGDGTVGIARRKNGTSDKYYYHGVMRLISGSKEILKQIQSFLKKEYGLNKTKIYNTYGSYTDRKYYRIKYCGSSAETFYHAIYDNSKYIMLDRKYYRYSNIVLLDNSELSKYHGKGKEGIKPLDESMLL